MKIKTFPGGYRFRHFEGQPVNKLIHAGIPPRVLIPLEQGFGSALAPLVKPGDTVRAGQIIARDDQTVSTPVHSSVNGTVKEILKRNYFNKNVTMVVIDADVTDDFVKLEGFSPQWEKLSVETLERLLYVSGATALDREGIPTRFKTSIIQPHDVEDLIIHCAGSEHYSYLPSVLLRGKNLFNFVSGIRILKRIMPRARVHFAINRDETGLIEKIHKLTADLSQFVIHPVIPKYPQGYDEVLIPTIVSKKFPYGYSAANIGIVVLTVQAVLHAYEAVAEGKPLIERIVALGGPSFKENTHLTVRIGTPFEFLLTDRIQKAPSRVIFNSLLTGPDIKDMALPVDRTFSQIIAIPENTEREFLSFVRPGSCRDSYSRSFLSFFLKGRRSAHTNMQGEERPCFQCGYCISVCPVRILPTLLNRLSKVNINENLMKHGIFNCIDCNLCSYVCPAKIPLAKNIKTAKSKLIDVGCDHSLCILPRFNLKGLEEYKGVKSIR